MSVVVSDTSPLRALAQLGLLHLTRDVFGQVLVPTAVAVEAGVVVPGLPVVNLGALDYVEIVPPLRSPLLDELRGEFGAGEAEAIALAVQVFPEAILIDEFAGRRRAERLGLRTIGAVGVLVRAKRAALIPEVRPLIDRLESEIGFRLSRRIKEDALLQAGESA